MPAKQMKKVFILAMLLLSLVISSCGAGAPVAATPTNDLLAKILTRGTIIIATDPAYPPQSELADAVRTGSTKCAANEYTAQEMTGFDISTAVEIAKRLGVEACFVTPQWGQLISGNWDGRWDLSVGSMALTPERLDALYFSQPYYSTPAALFVHQENTTFKKASDLSGKRVGACTGCTYEDFLRGTLNIPGETIDFTIKNPQIIGYDVDLAGLEDLAVGDGVNVDAVITSQPTGLQSIENGLPVKQLGEPVFFEYLSAVTDKKSSQSSKSLAVRVTEIIQSMHEDGTLAALSKQFYGVDYASVAGKFDIFALRQLP